MSILNIGKKSSKHKPPTHDQTSPLCLILNGTNATRLVSFILLSWFKNDKNLVKFDKNWHTVVNDIIASYLKFIEYRYCINKPLAIKSDQKIGSMYILNNYEIKFDIQTMGVGPRVNAAWPMIFRIGDGDSQRMPAIFMISGSTGLHVRQHIKNNHNSAVCHDGAIRLSIGKWHHIMMGFYQNKTSIILFDNKVIQTNNNYDWISTKINHLMPIYVAPKYGGGYVDKAKIKNLSIATW